MILPRVSTLLILVLLAGRITPTLGQTALIAHRSHSGTLATFDASTNDNFGVPPYAHVTDSVLRISDTLAVRHGRIYTYNNRTKPIRRTLDTLSYNVPPEAPKLTLEELREHYPNAKFIGFDLPQQAPAKQVKQKPKRSTIVPLSAPPTGPGSGPTLPRIMGVVAALLLLAALGWGAGIWRQAKARA